MIYVKPQIEILEVNFGLLSGSGPNAGDIGSPNVDDNYSVWDEIKQLNHKEESYEDKVYE